MKLYSIHQAKNDSNELITHRGWREGEGDDFCVKEHSPQESGANHFHQKRARLEEEQSVFAT